MKGLDLESPKATVFSSISQVVLELLKGSTRKSHEVF